METRYRVFLVAEKKYLCGKYRSFRDAKQSFIDRYWARKKEDRPSFEIHSCIVSKEQS